MTLTPIFLSSQNYERCVEKEIKNMVVTTNWSELHKKVYLMLKRPTLLAGVFFVVFCASALAGPFEDGLAAYERKDYVTAIELWTPLAGKGNAEAQFQLGAMYRLGLGVQKNADKAIEWLQLSAEQLNADAQRWLGSIYDHGDGVPQDPTLAVYWYKKAADQGDARAQLALGSSYFTGRGVDRDIVLAYVWLSISAKNLSEGAAFRENALSLLNAIAEIMTPEQVSVAQEMIKAWKRKHDEQE